jgi:hypothetical protein
VYLIKTDSFGNLQWNKTYGETGLDEARDLIQTSDGGYALCAVTITQGASVDFWLIKTDEEGDIQWDKKYGGG